LTTHPFSIHPSIHPSIILLSSQPATDLHSLIHQSFELGAHSGLSPGQLFYKISLNLDFSD
jgi:hypothetical protein